MIRYHLFVPRITPAGIGSVKNDGGVPSILAGLDSSKPAPGVVGRLYIATDTKWIYRDNGVSWDLIGTNAVTVNDVPVRAIEASTLEQITDQIIVTPANEVAKKLYSFIPLVQRGSLASANFSDVNDILVQGNYAYISGNNRVTIVDISNPLSPGVVSSISYDSAYMMDMQGIYLYVTNRDHNVAFIDVSDPTLPVLAREYLIGTYPLAMGSFDVIVRGSYLYILYETETYTYIYLRILDISTDPPTEKSTIEIRRYMNTLYRPDLCMAIKGNYLYIITGAHDVACYLTIVDVTDPSLPVVKNNINIESTIKTRSICVQGNYLYLAGYTLTAGKMAIYDITNPTNPTLKGSWETTNIIRDMVVYGNYAYLVNYSSASGNGTVFIVDISNSNSPTYRKSITSTDLNGASVIDVQGNYIYVVCNTSNKLLVFG